MPRAERRIAAAIGRTKKGEELGIEAAAGFVGVEGTMEDAKGLASDIAKRAASEALSQTDNVLSTAATNGFRRYLASREFQDAIVKEIGQAPPHAPTLPPRKPLPRGGLRVEMGSELGRSMCARIPLKLCMRVDARGCGVYGVCMKTTTNCAGVVDKAGGRTYCDDGLKLPGARGWEPVSEGRKAAAINRCQGWLLAVAQ